MYLFKPCIARETLSSGLMNQILSTKQLLVIHDNNNTGAKFPKFIKHVESSAKIKHASTVSIKSSLEIICDNENDPRRNVATTNCVQVQRVRK